MDQDMKLFQDFIEESAAKKDMPDTLTLEGLKAAILDNSKALNAALKGNNIDTLARLKTQGDELRSLYIKALEDRLGVAS